MKPAIVKAVLFDLDGTLIDSAPDLGAAADQMRTDRQLPSLPLANYRHMAGSGARGMLAVALGMTPEHADFLSCRDEFFNNYEKRLMQLTRSFDGVPELISALTQRGLAWGVVTNKASRFSQPLTEKIPMFTSMATLISGDTTAYSKPHPEPLLEAARRLQLAPAQCIYVGDDKRDMLAAQAAGMAGLAAAYGYLGEHAVDTWPHSAVLHTPADLLVWLDEQA